MKDKIDEIIDNLISTTISGELVWEDVSSKNTYKFKRSLISFGGDMTKFSIGIEYNLSNYKWKLEDSKYLWIENKTLPDGRMLLSNDKVLELKNILITLYCTDLCPKIEDVVDTLDDICRGISLSTQRDNRINKILDDK